MAFKKTIAEMEQGIADSEARTTIMSLFDEGSFLELGKFISSKGDTVGVVSGYGLVDGNPAYAFMQDVSVKSGAVCKAAAAKIAKVYELAGKNGAPVIAVYDSKGGDVSEGIELLSAYGDIACASASLSGVVPQIAMITGICGGTASTLACMADIIVMTKKAELFMTAPFVSADKTQGAGSAENAALSGASAITAEDTAEAIKIVRKLIGILPSNNLEIGGNDYFSPCETAASDGLKGADMVKAIADADSVTELYEKAGKASFVALGSLNWKTVGFVATNKTDSRLTAADSAKIARFVSFCDTFSIPVVTVVDSEGFELSSAAELTGSIRDAAKLTQIYATATTAKIALITGNAIGGAFTAFCGKNADFTVAFENAVIAPTTPKAAAVFLYADSASKEELNAKAEEYAAVEASPFTAAGFGVIDCVIRAEEAASAVSSAVEAFASKRVSAPARKHINFVY